MLVRLDPRAIERISGKAWDGVRSHFASIHEAIIAASPSARGALTTIYIKYTSDETGQNPFAVLWVKSSAELVLGISLPDTASLPQSLLARSTPNYKNMTAFLRFTAADSVPNKLAGWLAESHKRIAALSG